MSLLEEFRPEVGAALRVCAGLAERRFVSSHGGNLAVRLREDLILITPTKLNKGEVRAEDLVFVRPDGAVAEGTRRPTGELPMYLGFFRSRPDVRSAIHCHPPSTSAFAILQGENWLLRPLYPELAIEVGPVPVVPYGEPLTQQLADAFAPFLPRYNAFLMENHGLVLLSPEDVERALQLVDILELSAVSILQALAVGKIKVLSREALQGLENTRRTRDLPIIGAPGVNDSLVTLFATGPDRARKKPARAAHRRAPRAPAHAGR